MAAGLRVKHLRPEVVQQHLDRAETLCAQHGARLTPLRRRVLELVVQAGKPVGAYDILDRLRAEGMGSAPPTVYRALEFLQEQGLVHRVATANAFVACNQPGPRHYGVILICSRCGTALEVHDEDIDHGIEAAARSRGFEVEARPIEVSGLCAACREGSTGA
jgi:Fur family zinc uptake transcriptional regulator